VIWKGLEATLHEKDRSLEVNSSKLGDWGELSLLEAGASESKTGAREGEGKDGDENETRVKFGPKLKF